MSERGARTRRLAPEAVDLLLEVLEGPRPELSAAGARLAEGGADLLASGLLVPAGDEAVAAADDDHADAPVTLVAAGVDGVPSYYSTVAGLVPIAAERLAVHRVDVPRVLALLSRGFGLPRASRPMELVEGQVWELGAARLPRRRTRVTVWFARRPWDARGRAAVLDAARRRPCPQTRVLLTGAPARRGAAAPIPGFAVVPIGDVLVDTGTPVVDPAVLAAILGGPPPAGTPGPVALSPDGCRLTINGTVEMHFRSDGAKDAIGKLVAAYRIGKRLPIGELTPHGSMRRLFGPNWSSLRPYVKSVGGLWSFDP